MYIFKNALRNILRAKGRNILIGIIAFVIAMSSCVALSIKKAAATAETEGLNALTVTGEISRNREAIMKKAEEDGTDSREAMNNYPSLTLQQLQTYAKSSNVKDFYYTISSSINASGDLNPVDTSDSSESTEGDKTSNKDKNRVPGGIGKQGDFSIKGYSSHSAMSSFVSGTSKITSGEIFNEASSNMTCIISNELATLNKISVGGKITLANPNVETETYEFTVVGIYTDTQATTGDSMRFSTSSDPANNIYTSYNTLKSVVDLSTKNATTETNSETGKVSTTALRESTTGTYVFKDVNSFEAFKNDVKTMGLSKFYSVSSSDVTNYEQSLLPIKNISKFSDIFLIVVLVVGGVILSVLNIFNIRERKYEVGVLTAIGMKKWKVAVQYITEMFIVTFLAIGIGTAAGAAVSVPVANTLLESQISSQQAQVQQQNNNFGRQGGRPLQGEGRQSRGRAVQYISDINASTDITVVSNLVGIGAVLTIVSSLVGVVFIMRYEPLKILSNRT